MANAVVPWDQRPEYLAYTDWTPIPGVTSYAVPHPGSGTNVTQFHPGHAFLSEDNLPNTMYQLRPCAEWERFKRSPVPGFKHNPDGTLVYEQWTRDGKQRRPLRDFKILPDKISTEEAWWYLEFVRRMDPRICQRDIIMREEISEERLRMNNDSRYINIHLNTPGYRTYRPAWRMISWHVKGVSAKENDRKQYVLDRLTHAQKNANTTRGSTPGLINPALGEVPGNRIALPELAIKKRGPQRQKANAFNTSATQSAQPGQAPQNPGVSGAAQAPRARKARKEQARKTPQAPAQAPPQAAQAWPAGSSNAASAPFPVASGTIGTPSQTLSMTAAATGPNDLRGYQNVQARNAAAMPPPPLPLDPSNGRFPHTQEVFDLQLREASCSNWSPGFNDPQADVIEVEESTATNHHVPEPEYRFMSDEEIATSTKSEEAMKEIHRICEPFLGPDLNLRSPPPMDLSAAVIKEMGLDFKSQKQAAGEVRGKGKQDARPNPVQIRPNMAPEATPMPPNNQGTKRKEYDDDNEDFQHVQLDVEKQGSRPRKQVKLVHHANFQNGNGALYHNAAYNSQHQQYFAPRPGGLQSGYGYGQGFGGPTVQGARPHWGASVEDANTYNGGGPFEEQDGGIIGQQLNQTIEPFHSQSHPATHSGKAFSNRQSSVGSPYIPVSTARAQPSDFQPLSFQPGGPSEKSYYGNIQASQTLKGPPTISPAMPNAQPPSRQSPGTQFEPRADGRNNRGPLRQTSKNHRYNPYASSSKGNGQSMEIPQMHQPDGRDQLQTAWTPVAQAEEPYNPETIPSSSDNNPSPNGVPAFPQFLDLDNIFEYINDDPGQGIDLERTQKARDWILTV